MTIQFKLLCPVETKPVYDKEQRNVLGFWRLYLHTIFPDSVLSTEESPNHLSYRTLSLVE
jgi:hypothetical protein